MPPVTRTRNGIVRRVSVRQPTSKEVFVELNPRHNKQCMFCSRKEISEKLYGQLYQLNDIIVHYFCILLSSRAVQKGSDKEGIWGFLYKDIKAELKRASREVCVYCKNTGATISCCGTRCRKVFHLPCGLQNGSMHQYFKSFKSFCNQHRITQAVDLDELRNNNNAQCSICKEEIQPYPSQTNLWAPCCKRNAWFHRDCIQDLALSAGYFFKCPLCNNVDTFKGRMLTLGIYIPSSKDSYLKKSNHRDASWETVPNAYAELLERHNSCNVEKCMCPYPEKRRYQLESGSWEIILCNTCGSNGTHKLCSSIKFDQTWICSSCKTIVEGPSSAKKKRSEIQDSITITPESRATRAPSLFNNFRNRSFLGNNTTVINVNGRNIARCLDSASCTILNNNKEPSRNIETGNPAPIRQQLGDVILISDSDDNNDSDLECTSVVSTPMIPPPPVPIPARRPPLPIISSYTSMSTGSTTHFQNGFRIINPNNQPKIVPHFITASIDLTSDDDET